MNEVRVGGQLGWIVASLCAVGCSSPAPETAPETFRVALTTSQGPVEIEFVREWSPLAVDRVFALVESGHWDGARIYRVNEAYAQFGFSGVPEADAEWMEQGLPDEPPQTSNVRGSVSFARGGPGTRAMILFINRVDNTNLDEMAWNGVTGFPPVGRVVAGLENVDALYDGYGDLPMQFEDSIRVLGNAFLDRSYPLLDSITAVRLLEPEG